MTVPTATPGTLGRARAWLTKTPRNERAMTRRVAGASLLAALLATTAVALTGVLATADAQAAAHPDDRSTSKATAATCPDEDAILVTTKGRWRCRNMYMARVALDGRKHPNDSRRGAKIDMLRAGEWVNIRCQITGAGGRLYDRVGDYFVPDKYMRTFYTGSHPGCAHVQEDVARIPPASTPSNTLPGLPPGAHHRGVTTLPAAAGTTRDWDTKPSMVGAMSNKRCGAARSSTRAGESEPCNRIDVLLSVDLMS
jgi:hypothetical protein